MAQYSLEIREAALRRILPLNPEIDACQLSSVDTFEIVVATASMNETQLGEFARSRGLFVEQIKT